MKTSIKLTLLGALAAGFIAMPALAQDQGGNEPPPPKHGMEQGQGQDGRQQQFEARKAEILARLQQAASCVQAAQDPQSLRACRPKGGPEGDNQGGGAPPPPQDGGDDQQQGDSDQ